MHGALKRIPGALHETDGYIALPNPVQRAQELGLRCTTALLNFADNAGLHRSQLLVKWAHCVDNTAKTKVHLSAGEEVPSWVPWDALV